MDLVSQFMQNIDNCHHGKFYLNPVAWEKVFSPLPIITKRTGFEMRPTPPKPVQQPRQKPRDGLFRYLDQIARIALRTGGSEHRRSSAAFRMPQ
jgi:hypothetical protein